MVFQIGKQALGTHYYELELTTKLSKMSIPLIPEICNNGIDDDGDGLIDSYDPDCHGVIDCFVQGEEEDFSAMAPEIHCTAILSAPSAYSSPIAGDVDGDGDVEIMVLNHQTHELVIISGVDCSVEAQIAFPSPSFETKAGNIALGDVDQDGYIDMFVAYGRGTLDVQGIKRIEYDGTSYQEIWATTGVATADRKHVDIIDINQDGSPEIIPNGGFMVNSITGAIYPGALPTVENRGKGLYAFTADADAGNNGNEGDVELILGVSIYRYDFTADNWNLIRDIATHSGTWNVKTKVSLADLDLDGDIDAIACNHDTNTFLAWDLQTTTIFAESNYAGPPGISRAAIGNFDDDAEPEFVFIHYNSMEVIDDIVNSNASTFGFSNLWSLSITDPSAHTQVSLFDFDADGKKEIVYRGEEELYIYRGEADAFNNAQEIYNSGTNTITSETGIEYPVIVDANGDGQANIVTISDSGGALGEGLHIFKSAGIPWAPSRNIWNTQAYIATNVNDDGTIPAVMQENYLVYNNFLGQQGTYTPLPPDQIPSSDLLMTVATAYGINGIVYDNCPTLGLALEICNQGDASIDANLNVEVYDGDPNVDASAEFIGVYSLVTPIDFSQCVTDTLYFTPNTSTNYDFHFIINHSDPTGVYPLDPLAIERDHLECDYTNNVLSHSFSCNRPPELVNDSIEVCSEIAVVTDVLANDTDYDNNIDGTTLTIVTPTIHGTAGIVGGEITYTSDIGYAGLDSLEYQVSDTGFPVFTETAWMIIDVVSFIDAGTSTTVNVCNTEAPVDLITLLGGTPDAGGEWTGGLGNVHSNIFDPSFEASQIMTYAFPSGGTCAGTSTVDITVLVSASAGVGGSFEVCSSENMFNMLSLLTAVSDPSGNWYDSSSNAVSALFNPGITPDDNFIYVLPGTGSCPNDTAFVTITTEAALNAGSNGTLNVCEDSGNQDLFGSLTGSPDALGSWQAPDNSVHSGTLAPSLLESGVYTYLFSSTANCPQASAEVDVTIEQLANTGTGVTITVCETNAPLSLFDELAGSPDAGGYWLDTFGAPHSGLFDPAADIPGTYTYNIDMPAPCHTVSTAIDVQVSASFSPGVDTSVILCESSTPQGMFGMLNGSPDANGTWSFGGANVSINNFDPLSDPVGVYNYTVPQNGSCSALTASLTVAVTSEPIAGGDASVQVCTSSLAVDLTSLLNGTPEANGQWYDDSNQPIPAQFDTSYAGTYDLTYVVSGVAPCLNDTAYLELEVQQQLSAGTGLDMIVCENGSIFDLNDYLSSGVDLGGNWYDPSNNLHSGIITPGVSVSGGYTYEVISPSACSNPIAVFPVTIELLPDAGVSGGSVFFCDVFPGFDLYNSILGTPQVDGYFTNPSNEIITDFTSPNDQVSGVYTYHANPVNVCPETTSTLDVTINNIGSVGADTGVLLCETVGEVDLTALLIGSPDGGGQWLDELNNPISNLYTPTAPTVLTYQKNGGFPCPTISADLSIAISQMTYAGDDDVITSCEIDDNYNLTEYLDVNASGNGYWQDPSGNVIANTVIDPDVNETGEYLYLTTPNAQCPQDTATYTVVTQNLPNAGEDGFLLVCSLADPVNLMTYLGGTPDPGGVWLGPDNTPVGAEFNPNLDVPGEYTYQVAGTVPCPTNAATASVQVVMAPYAGEDLTLDLCSTDDPLDITTLVSGGITPNSYWLNEDGNIVINPIEDPSDLVGSVFKLVAPANAPCVNDTAFFTVNVNQPVEITQLNEIVLCGEDAFINFDDYFSLNFEESFEYFDSGLNVIPNTFDPSVNESQTITLVGYSYLPCGSNSLDVDVVINHPGNPGEDALVDVCNTDAPFDPFDLIGGSPDAGGTFIWQGETYASIEFDPSLYSGSHVIEYIANSEAPCNSYSSFLQIDIHETPEPEFTIDDEDAELSNPIFYFENETDGEYNFTWDFDGLDSATSYDAEFTFPGDISDTYMVCLYAEDLFGCEATECQSLEVKDILSYFIPNTFTPNGDGENDEFLIRGRGIDENFFELFIYSRNGDQVFHTQDLYEGWDGTWYEEDVPIDIYSFRLIIKAKDTSERKEVMGHITLLK